MINREAELEWLTSHLSRDERQLLRTIWSASSREDDVGDDGAREFGDDFGLLPL